MKQTNTSKLFYKNFLGITPRVLVPLLLLLSLAFILLSFLASKTISEIWMDTAERDAELIHQLTGNIINSEYDQLAESVKLLADSSDFTDKLVGGDIDALLPVIIQEKLRSNLDRVVILDQAGRVMIDTESLGYDSVSSVDEEALLGLREINGRYIKTDQLGTSLNAFSNITASDGTPLGVVVGSINITDEWASEIGSLAKTYITIFSAYGIYASNFPDSRIFQLQTYDTFEAQSRIVTLKSNSSTHTTREDNDLYYVRYSRLQLSFDMESQLYIAIITPLDQLAAARTSIVQKFILISLITYIFIIVFIYLILLRRIITPLKKIAHIATQVTHGDLNHSSRYRAPDEIGLLSQNFDKMIDTVRATQKKERELTKIKDEFISIAAHQLRTPLTAIKWVFGFMQAKESKNTSKDQRELTNTGLESVERMNTIINQVLDTSKIDRNVFSFSFSHNKLDELLKKRSTGYALLAKNRDVAFSTDIQKSCAPACLDPEKICMAIDNIVDNAIYYTPEGGSVKLTLVCKEDLIEIKVTDTGIGLDPKIKNEVFKKFSRGENARSKHTDGSGLGLYIANRILKEHNAKLSIDNNKPSGTIVIITIPISDCLN